MSKKPDGCQTDKTFRGGCKHKNKFQIVISQPITQVISHAFINQTLCVDL